MQTLNIEVREQLFEMYVNKELSTRVIARQLGKTTRTITRWIKEYEIPERDQCGFEFPELRDKQWLNNLYTQQKKSTSEIGKIVNASAETVRRWLIMHNIPRRKRITKKEVINFVPNTRQAEVSKHKNGSYWTALL
jgi:transposase